jgi:glycosyltransferase involved in cell wall biosynthesis
VNVVHVFPYSARILGGHANAIRGFIACQRAKQINAVGVSPKPDAPAADTTWEFPLAEVDSLWSLRWADIAERFGIAPGNSLLNLHTVDRRYAPLLGDLRRAGVPHVLTSHGQLGFQNAWRWLKKFVYLHCVNRGPIKAAGLHVLSRFAARRMRLLLPGFQGIKLVQGNLVNLPNLAELPAVSKSDYAIPQSAFVLLFLGRLDVWVKGLDLLVEAFSCLPAERFHLVLVGPDWQGGKASLEQLATRFGCGDRVHFVGRVYGQQKWSLLRLADVFVSPSRWEAFSIAQAEAMAIGLPLVTSTKINLASELREADAALLTPLAVEPLAKAITTLEADAERWRAVSNRGQAWAEKNCNPERAGARFLEFYQSILEKPQGAGGRVEWQASYGHKN